jgi:transposase-like protein
MSNDRSESVSPNGTPTESLPETEVRIARKPRKVTAAFKRSFLKQAEACQKPGELGALLRREGLYYSTLADWKRQRANGALDGLSPGKPGPKENPSNQEIARLKRENQKLSAQLDRAKAIVSVQKKLSRLLGISLLQDEET